MDLSNVKPQQLAMARLMPLTPELYAHYADIPLEAPVSTTAAPALPVRVAMTTTTFYGRVKVHLFPMQTPEEAREEYGATLADAKAFVQGTTCLDCGVPADEIRECSDCGIPACNCVVTEDPHVDDVYWCNDCQRVCGCDGCNA